MSNMILMASMCCCILSFPSAIDKKILASEHIITRIEKNEKNVGLTELLISYLPLVGGSGLEYMGQYRLIDLRSMSVTVNP